MISEANELKEQLQKIKLLDAALNLNPSMVLGYLMGSLAQVNKATTQELSRTIHCLFEAFSNNVFKKSTALEMIVVLKMKLQSKEFKHSPKIFDFYNDCLLKLVQDSQYLQKKYFTNQLQPLSRVINPQQVLNPSSKIRGIKPLSRYISYFDILERDKPKPLHEPKPLTSSLLKLFKKQQEINVQKEKEVQKSSKIMNTLETLETVETLEKKSSMGLDCPICIVQIAHKDICILSCDHMMHKKCFELSMNEIISKKSFPLKCPVEECGIHVQDVDLRQYLPKAIVDKYYEFTFHNFVDKNHKDMSWCPTPGCPSVFQYDQSLTNYKCPSCNKNYCLSCKCEMHVGVSCEVYKDMNNMSEQDKQFVQFAKGAEFKQCPKCKFWVQRNKGCHHMTCRCSFQFCFKCGDPYGNCDCEEKYADYYGDDDSDYDENQEYRNQQDVQIRSV